MSSEKDFYNNLRKNEWLSIEDYGPSVKSRFNIIFRLISKYKARGPVLDIGCGTGGLLNKLRKFFKNDSYGADISSEALKIAKRKYQGMNFFIIDLEKIDRKHRSQYNTVICSEVLEHVKKLKQAVKNLNFLLKKEGLLFISVPYQMQYWTPHDEFSGHVRRFEKNKLESLLKRSGFRILERFSWGIFIYDLYYRIMGKIPPKKLMKTRGEKKIKIYFKKFVSLLLYFLFCIEYYFRDLNCNKGRRLFIVAKKR